MSDIVAFLYSNAWRIAGVAAIVVLAVAAALIGDTADFSASLAMTSQGVTNLFKGQADFGSLTTKIAYRYAPSSMRGAGNSLVTPWSGTVTYAPDANTSMFDVNVTNVPVSQCTNLGNAMSAAHSVSVGGTVLSNTGNGIDAGALSNACGDTGNVTLTFVMGK